LDEQKRTISTAKHRNSSIFNQTENLLLLLNSERKDSTTPSYFKGLPFNTNKINHEAKPLTTATERMTAGTRTKEPRKRSRKKENKLRRDSDDRKNHRRSESG